MKRKEKEFLMKLYTLALALAAVTPAMAASNYYGNGTGYTSRGGSTSIVRDNFYGGSQPTRTTSSRTAYSPNYNYNNGYSNGGYTTRERQVTTRTYSSQERKYFLAHPFFQPLKGRFGSVTDFAYATNNFKFDILNGSMYDLDTGALIGGPDLLEPLSGKEETTQFLVKEDFSFGLSDTLAVIGMVQYDSTKTSFKDWSEGSAGDSYSKSGLNLFGIGLQNRFIDNDEWIAMVAGYFQHQKDTANTFLGELKAGYKIDRTTVYGLLRAGYSVLTKGDIYGAYVESDGDYMMLAYKTDVKDIFQIEGGIGAFGVLNKYFTLNGELIYGHYDWHNQLNLKGSIGWQPGDMFALNLYGLVSLYDSAKDKTKHYMQYDVNPESYATGIAYTTGDYDIKDYNEWKIGVQAILYF